MVLIVGLTEIEFEVEGNPDSNGLLDVHENVPFPPPALKVNCVPGQMLVSLGEIVKFEMLETIIF
jgi:hypothetical protein